MLGFGCKSYGVEMIFHSVVILDYVSKIVMVWSSSEKRLSNSEFGNPQEVFEAGT